jgi:hypothetical protein
MDELIELTDIKQGQLRVLPFRLEENNFTTHVLGTLEV